MYPVYPTKTFPNHYSLATGLFPEIHGIVDNFVFDPNLNPEVVDIKRPGADPRFYKGEPVGYL